MKIKIDLTDPLIASIPVSKMRQVVLIDVAGRKDIPSNESNANIYCIDSHGNVVWQIDAPRPKMDRDSFVSLRKTLDGLRADRFFGGEFIIDELTGVATEIGWHK